MSTQGDLARLQRALGYEFRAPQLLELALTHKSYSKHNNERLEFVGDAVLGYVIAAMLYRDEGTLGEDALSLMRARLVRGTVLADVARDLDMAASLRLGVGERKSGGAQRDSILADAFEAVLGAIHEDGGIGAVREVVEALFSDRIEALDPRRLKDAKTRLQEWLQARQLPLPEYRVDDVSGADHERRYTVSCLVAELDLSSSAEASSRRGGEQAAAMLLLEQLAERGLG